jgi:hypothetical protein
VENYLHVSKQAVGKFALGLRTTGFRTTIPNTVLQGCKLLSDIRQCQTKFGKCPSKSNFDWTLVRSQKNSHIIHFFAVTKSDCKFTQFIFCYKIYGHSSILLNVVPEWLYTYLSRDLYISDHIF